MLRGEDRVSSCHKQGVSTTRQLLSPVLGRSVGIEWASERLIPGQAHVRAPCSCFVLSVLSFGAMAHVKCVLNVEELRGRPLNRTLA